MDHDTVPNAGAVANGHRPATRHTKPGLAGRYRRERIVSAARTPPPDDLRFAADWLRQYDDEHDGGEDTARCARIADWLDEQAIAKDLRDAAREHGLPVGKLRSKLREDPRAQ